LKVISSILHRHIRGIRYGVQNYIPDGLLHCSAWAGIASAQQAPYIEQQPPVEVLNASIYQCAFSSSTNLFCFVGSNNSLKIVDASTLKEEL